MGETGALRERLRRLPGYAALRVAYNLVRGGRSRSVALLRLLRPTGMFQPYAETSMNRYPHIFARLRDVLEDGPDAHILSFGCSTGEEVFSLRTLFPQAAITGLDINRRSIAVCRARQAREGHANIRFSHANGTQDQPSASYDAIFAMAVFRHGDLGEAPPDCSHLLRFEDFDRAIADLARCLKPGGLLAFRHSHFLFAETSSAPLFEPVLAIRDPRPPVYGADNRLRDPALRREGLFRKRWSGAPD